jgi:hypothetical protein
MAANKPLVAVVLLALLVIAATFVLVPEWTFTTNAPRPPVMPEPAAAAQDAPLAPHEREEVAAAAAPAGPDVAAGSLRVRAIDAAGRPVPDARLLITLLVRKPDSAEQPISHRLPPTDVEGIAVLPAPAQSCPASCSLLRANVRAELLGGDGAEVDVDVNAPSNRPVDVPVPPFGQLQVALLGQDGEPWTLPAESHVEVWITATPGQIGTGGRVGADGCATIPRVRCSAALHVCAPGRWLAERDVEGPRRQGETARVELQLPAAAVVLTGRLLRSDRQPFDGEVSVWDAGPLGGCLDPTLPVATDGRFRLVLQPNGDPRFGGMRARDISCRALGGDHLPTGEEADLAKGLVLHAGRNDVGDAVLTMPPLLVAGRVLDAEDRAPAGADLQFERTILDQSPQWRAVGVQIPVRLDAEGRFAVHAFPRGCRYRLQLRGAGRAQTVEFATGTADLLLRVDTGGSVTATFLPDALVDLLEVKLVPPATPSEPRAATELLTRLRGLPRRNGDRVRFHWDGLDPGAYQFVVANGTRTLLQFGIDVGEGEVRDPRLLEIDLRNQVQALRVRVTDAAGQRLPLGGALYVHGSSDPADWAAQGFSPTGSSIATFPVDRPADLFVVAKDFRTRMLAGVTGDVHVVMSPAPKFTLHCAQLVGLAGIRARLGCMLATPPDPAAPVKAGRRFVSQLEQTLLSDGLPQTFDGGTAAASFTSALPVTLDVQIGRQGFWSRPLALQPAVIDGDALVEGQTIELTLDPTLLQQALDELARR